MTDGMVTISNGFAEVGAGAWLMSRGQPASFVGETVRRRLKGWIVRDRSALDLVETAGRAWCADAVRPFLTHIPCAAPVSAVSAKVLLAPARARLGAETVKLIPMSLRCSLCVTSFGLSGDAAAAEPGPGVREPNSWIVLATASRTARLQVGEDEMLSVRPESVVAWTGNRPTGFIRKLGLRDFLLPGTPRDLMLHFFGPCLVWIEGAAPRPSTFNPANRRAWNGV